MKSKILKSLLVFTIIFASCSTDELVDKLAGDIKGTITTYSDVEFSLKGDGANFFASTNGNIYNKAGVTAEILPTIDLIGASNTAFIAFESPSENDVKGTETKIQHTNVAITVDQFDNMEDALFLKVLVGSVKNDEESISLSKYKEKIILFENKAGKVGVIKLKAINSERLLVDIKVMN